MKINNIPDSIDSSLDLEQIRQECLDMVKKRAYFSAGAAAVPIPFFDVVIDIGILSQLIPQISASFGLSPEHITVYDPKTKEIHWNELRKRGIQFSGFVMARTAVKKSFNGLVSKVLTRQVTKFIPLGGQVVAASLGYFVLKKVADAHVEECYNLAKSIQQRQKNQNIKTINA